MITVAWFLVCRLILKDDEAEVFCLVTALLDGIIAWGLIGHVLELIIKTL
jgi:hypothetical protein